MNVSSQCKCGHALSEHRIYPTGATICHGVHRKYSTLYGHSSLHTCMCKKIKLTFDSYYRDIYLPRHRKAATKAWHLIGLIATALYLGVCISHSFWAGLILAPFVVYPFAWTSHVLLEDNKPAAWSNPFYAKAADIVMCYQLLRGKLDG